MLVWQTAPPGEADDYGSDAKSDIEKKAGHHGFAKAREVTDEDEGDDSTRAREVEEVSRTVLLFGNRTSC